MSLAIDLLFQVTTFMLASRISVGGSSGYAVQPTTVGGVGRVTPLMIFVGDSQTALGGIQPRIANCLAGLDCTSAASTKLFNTYTYANGGIGVINMDQFDAQVASWFSASQVNTMTVLLWGGTNDLLSFGETAQQTYDAIVARVTAYRAMGYTRIIISTCITIGSAKEADRQALNVLIRAGAGSSTYGVADIGAAAHIGTLGDELDPAYFNADHLHLVAGGWDVVSPIVTAAIQALP